MAKGDFKKNYRSQSEDYRGKYSRDEFRGQKQNVARRRAMKAAEKENEGSLTKKQRTKVREENPIDTQGKAGSQYYATGEDGRRRAQDIGKGANPFKVENLDDFDLAAYGKGSARGEEKLNLNDARRLMQEGGFSAEQLSDYAGSLGEGKVAGRAQKFLDRRINQLTTNQPETDAQIDDGSQTPGATTPDPKPAPAPEATPEQKAVEMKNKTVTDIKQTQSFARDFGDVTGTINTGGGSNYGDIGNKDFSVNIGSNVASAGSGAGNTYSSDLDGVSIAARYGALNENAYERSRDKMTGAETAAGAIERATASVGADENIEKINTSLREGDKYFQELAKKQSVLAFGDYMSPYYTAPKFNPAAPPEEIKVNYDGE